MSPRGNGAREAVGVLSYREQAGCEWGGCAGPLGSVPGGQWSRGPQSGSENREGMGPLWQGQAGPHWEGLQAGLPRAEGTTLGVWPGPRAALGLAGLLPGRYRCWCPRPASSSSGHACGW